MFLLISVAFVALLLYLNRRLLFWSKRPPGPPIYPFLGSFPALGEVHPDAAQHPYEAMHRLSVRHGPVIAVGLGPDIWISLSALEPIKEFCMMEETLTRPESKTFHELYSFEEELEPLGVIFADGPLWREHRKFMTKTLKEMGVGKRSMDDHILEEVRHCVDHLHKLCSESNIVEMQLFFNLPSLNVIWQLVCGRRFNYDNKEMMELIDHIEAFTMEKFIGPIVGMPLLKFIPPFSTIYKSVKNHMAIFKSYLSNFVCEEKRKDPVDDVINYMSAYFSEQSKDRKYFSDKQLIISMQDFFTGGSGTMSKTMSYGILYMIHHPEVQRKVQAELDRVTSEMNTDAITLEMKSQLPYTEATVSEVQRLASVLPIAPPRLATKDIEISGYRIPKGLQVQCNLYALHRNPDHWTDPQKFKPERFLTEDGSSYKPDEWLQPFGYGKRKCLGESIAKSAVFLFFANLLWRFEFLPDPTDEKPSLLPEGGLTIGPRKFYSKVVPRF